MPDAPSESVAVPEPVAGEASAPPTVLVIALWVPVFAVVLWFMVRLFAGRWITDPAPRFEPPPPDDPAPPGR